jgi:CheY-like chemotaxis protein
MHVRADADRLQQVLANLLSNAAKFSPPGASVEVRAKAMGTQAVIEVEDHGGGIPVEFHSKIFEKFAQADSSAARVHEGTGLGLSIARKLVEAMQGTISFSSVLGRGTVFRFTLPLQATPAPTGPRASSASTGERRETGDKRLPRILHVEDDADLSEVLARALEGHAIVDSARTLAAAETMLDHETFALIVIDPSLPDGSGLSLLDTSQAIANTRVPVVILSADDIGPKVRQRVTAALVKSRVSEKQIVRTLIDALGENVGALTQRVPTDD